MKAVFIGAHNDDCEYCAGGMAYLLSKAGFDIFFLKVACKRREYRKHNGRTDSFRDPVACAEFTHQDCEAARIIGANCRIIGGYGDDYYKVTSDNLQLLKDAVEDIMPDIAFIHWVKDNHWEHVEVSKAAFQVLCEHSQCEIHAFEAGPWQSMGYMIPDFLIDITPAMPTIDQSLMMFNQPLADGSNLVREKHAAARFRGYMAGFEFAEGYKILRFPPERFGTELMLPKLFGKAYHWGGGDQYPIGRQYYA